MKDFKKIAISIIVTACLCCIGTYLYFQERIEAGQIVIDNSKDENTYQSPTTYDLLEGK